MLKQQIGVIGMAVMGRNLALNIESKNYTVSIFNRTKSVTEEIIKNNKQKKIFPYFSIQDFVNSLEKPRCVLLMVKSGQPTDDTIQSVLPYLDKGDILIDAGNTFYKDTIRRNNDLFKYGIHFIGMGVSGGESGALNGPSIMPGGSKKAYDLVAPMLRKISAKFKNEPCVSYIGPNGAGHYVKMIHNGIEYGDMQLIAESYFILKNLLNMNNSELSDIFSNWNKGELNSYLIEITKNIFIKKEENDVHYLIDYILDEAEDKGTGKWISKDSLELREPLSLITESVFARYISSLKDQRVLASKILKGPIIKTISSEKKAYFIEEVRKALYLGKIISYAQGFSQLKKASEKYSWNLQYGEIAKIFRSGCIIRAGFLEKITDAFQNNSITNLLLTPYFSKISNKYEMSLRYITSYAIKYGIPVPAFSAAITYYDNYRTVSSSANLIQAQRDYFGAHMYKRIDKKGYFHTNWLINKK